MTRADGLTVGLLLAALGLHLSVPVPDLERRRAERLLGSAERVPIEGAAAYRSGDRAALFFAVDGMQGPIHGAVVLSGDRIAEVVVWRSVEGLDRRLLRESDLLALYRGMRATPPLVPHAVTGASVSSRRVMEAVNDRLAAWNRRSR